MNKPTLKTALYISSREDILKESDVSKRVHTLRREGYVVTRFTVSPQTTFGEYLILCKLAMRHDVCFIYIEESGTTDKMTLIKFVNPHLSITWDLRSALPVIHKNSAIKNLLYYLRHTLKRYILSFLVANYRLTSSSQRTIPRQLAHKPQSIIQNFTLSDKIKTKKSLNASQIIQKLIPNHSYTVVCLSNPQNHNTALDTIEKVASIVYKKNKNILFILVGEHPWHTTSWNKNILFINPLPDNLRLALLHQSDVGLALYTNTFFQPYIDEPYELNEYAHASLACITTLSSSTTHFASPSQYLASTSVADISALILSLKSHKA